MAIKTRYRIKSKNGQYDVVHFQTSADQVITSNDMQFVTAEEKKVLEQSKGYVHNQMSASKAWQINHNLEKFPSVSIVDSAGSLVTGDIVYKDRNNLEISFTSEFAGIAYLN